MSNNFTSLYFAVGLVTKCWNGAAHSVKAWLCFLLKLSVSVFDQRKTP